MTVRVFGDTAEDARKKAVVDPESDVTIGLNHQEDIDAINKMIRVKKAYTNLRKGGTWQEQVERAVANSK